MIELSTAECLPSLAIAILEKEHKKLNGQINKDLKRYKMIISQNQAGTTKRRMVIDCWKISVKKLYLRVDQKTVCGRICV